MKQMTSFMRAYMAIMEEKARQVDYMQKIYLIKLYQQHNDKSKVIIRKIEEHLNKKQNK